MTGQALSKRKVGIEELNEPVNDISNTRHIKQALENKLINGHISIIQACISPSSNLEVDNLAISRALDTGMVSPWKYPAANLPKLYQ